MNNFVKSFLSFGLATSIEKLLGFIILPIYTRHFSAEEYGVIDLIGTVLSVSIIFGGLQLETSLQRYYYEYNKLRQKLLISNVYLLVLICSIIVGSILFFLSSNISIWLFKDSKYSLPIKLVSIQIPIQNISMLGLVLLRYTKENVKFLSVVIVKVITSLLFVYILVIHLKLELNGVFLAQLLSLVCSTILVTYFNMKHFILNFNRRLINILFSYSLPQFPARIGSMSLGQANRFFMLSFLSLQAIGIYTVSLKLASMIQLLNTAFIMAWNPMMHKLFSNKNNKEIFSAVLPLLCSVTFLGVCFITFFSQEIVRAIASQEFYSSYKYVGGLSLFFAFYIIKEVVDIGPKITKKTKYLSYNFLFSVIVNLVSLYFLIKFFLLPGVVAAMIITNLFLVFISWYTSNKLYYIPFSIWTFVVLLVPTLIACFISLFSDLSLLHRIILLLAISFYYCLFGVKSYKKLKILL